MLVVYILLGIFFCSTVVLTFLYLRNLNRLKKISEDILHAKIRKGYFNEKVNLLRDSDSDKNDSNSYDVYEAIIYISELDRYTNGTSKISLDKVEVISGWSPNQYDYIKNSIIKRFCSLRKTSDIDWLESENNIKEMRKEKLNKIIKK